jgi:hypothetical protein
VSLACVASRSRPEVDTGPSPTDARYCFIRDGKLRTLLRTWGIPLSDGAMDLLQVRRHM